MMPPEMTPAQIRARRAHKKRIIDQSIKAGLLPKNVTALPPGTEPAGKLFELEDIRRIPVNYSMEVWDVLGRGHHETRILPVALSEEFGALEDEDEVDHIDLSLVLKEKYFGVTKHEYHPVTGEPPTLLEIYAYFKNGDVKVWRVNVHDLWELNPRHEPAFEAHKLASELHRLHLEEKGRE